MPDRPQLRALILLLAFCVPTLFVGLGSSSLWEPDEPRFAEASREMLERGDYLTPYFNGAPRFQKPPLLYWMQILSFQLFGINELGARVPVALCGAVSVLLIYLLGLRFFTQRAALLAALALATTFRFVVYSRHGLTDVPVLMFMLAAFYGFARTLDEPTSSRRFALIAWASLGLAMLTKGPVGLFPLPIWILFLLSTRQRGGLRRLHAVSGLLLFTGIAAPWFVYMAWKHGETYLEFALLSEVVDRYVTPHSFPQPSRGLFYYFKVVPPDAIPWTLYFLAALPFVGLRWSSWEARERRGVKLLLLWFLVVFVLFSLSGYKLPHYIIPLYPPMSVLVGFFVDRAAGSCERVARLSLAVPAWLTASLFLGLSVLSFRFMERVFGSSLFSSGTVLPAALAAGAILVCIFQWRGLPIAAVGAVAGMAATGYMVVAVSTIPDYLERFKAIRPLSEVIASQHRPGDRIGVYRDVGQGFVFYTGQTVEWLYSPAEVRNFLAKKGRAFCVMRERDLWWIRRAYRRKLHLLGKQPLFLIHLRNLLEKEPAVNRTKLIVVSNRRLEP